MRQFISILNKKISSLFKIKIFQKYVYEIINKISYISIYLKVECKESLALII
jgi:hypothetical protein